MARVSQQTAAEKYRTEARFALARVRHYQEQGDAARVDEWHRAWSRAQAALDAELRERGGGAKLLRQNGQPPLRSLPQARGVPEALVLPARPTAETSEISPFQPVPRPLPAPATPAAPDLLPAALQRQSRIDQALRSGGPNPYPDELEEDDWERELTLFRLYGPYESKLLQDAEEAVEVLTEFRPEFWPEPDGEDEVIAAERLRRQTDQHTLAECFRIYAESLPELTEGELYADLLICQQDSKTETVRLIEAELRRRDRELPGPT